MAAGHPNIDVAKRIWTAAARGDADALAQVFADDVVWHSHGQGPLAGEFRGRDAVIAQFARFADHVDDLRLDLQDIYVSARGAVIHYAVWARRGELKLETDFQLRLEIEGGRVTHCHVVPSDQRLTSEFLTWTH